MIHQRENNNLTSANVLFSTAIKWAQMKHFHANVWFWLTIRLRYDPKTSQFTSIRPFYYVAIVSEGPYQQAWIIFMYFILSLMVLWYVCTKNTLFRVILDKNCLEIIIISRQIITVHLKEIYSDCFWWICLHWCPPFRRFLQSNDSFPC